MMAFVLMLGIYPYRLPHQDQCPYFREIAAGRLLPMLEGWKMGSTRISAAGLDFLHRMLCVDPVARMGVAEALAHEWLRPLAAGAGKGAAAGAGGVAATALAGGVTEAALAAAAASSGESARAGAAPLHSSGMRMEEDGAGL